MLEDKIILSIAGEFHRQLYQRIMKYSPMVLFSRQGVRIKIKKR